MNDKLFELLKTIETLDDKELSYLCVWIEYNQQKREALSTQPQTE